MWTPTTRQQHSRPITRYQTDLTDAEWRVIAPHLPKPCAMGRPREWPMREIINGIFYVMRAGTASFSLQKSVSCALGVGIRIEALSGLKAQFSASDFFLKRKRRLVARIARF